MGGRGRVCLSEACFCFRAVACPPRRGDAVVLSVRSPWGPCGEVTYTAGGSTAPLTIFHGGRGNLSTSGELNPGGRSPEGHPLTVFGSGTMEWDYDSVRRPHGSVTGCDARGSVARRSNGKFPPSPPSPPLSPSSRRLHFYVRRPFALTPRLSRVLLSHGGSTGGWIPFSRTQEYFLSRSLLSFPRRWDLTVFPARSSEVSPLAG